LAAVRAYQTAQGLTAANQVGPMTRAKLNAQIAGTGSTGGSVVIPTGPVSAVLAFDNPAAGALIGSQAIADMLHVNFTGTGTVTSVTLKRTGISDQNLFTNVYLYDGNVRITDGYAFNVNGVLTMTGLNIAVSGSKVISVRGDVMAGAVSTQGSAAIALTGFAANGSAVTANVQGNMFSVISGSAAGASLSANTYVGTTPEVSAGTSQYTSWGNTLTITTRAVQLKGMSLKMIGSAPINALTNIKLFINGINSGVVATVREIQGSNYAIFDLASAPITVATGTNSLEVRADVSTGASRTIQLSLQQAADAIIYDPQVGVNVAVGGTVPNTGANITIKTGSSTVVVDPTFNNQTNITAGSSNVVIGKYTIHGYSEDVKVNTLYVLPIWTTATFTGGSTCTSNTNCSLANVTLYFNGVQIGSQKNWSGTGNLDYTLGSQMIIPAGVDSTLEVRTDLQSSSTCGGNCTSGENYTGGTIQARLVGYTGNSIGQTSQASVSVPATTGTNVTTNGLALSSGSLSVSKNATFGGGTTPPNQSNVKIGSFTVQNQSTSEAVRLTTLTVALTSNGSTALTATELTGLASLRIGLNGVPVQPSASNVFSVSDVLQPNASMTVDIYANVGSSSLISAVVTRLTVGARGVSSNVDASASIQTGQTVSFGTGTLSTLPTKNTNVSTAASYVAAYGGATDASRNTFNVTATGGTATISELKFTVVGTTTGVSSVRVGTVSAPIISGTAWLTGLNLAVPNAGAGLDIDAYASYPDVSINGVLSGSVAKLSLVYIKYASGGTTKTLCTTTIGGCTANMTGGGTGGAVEANQMTLVGSKPSVALTLPNGASGTTQTGLSVATIYMGDVKVTADSRGSIKVNTIKVTFVGNASGTHVTGASTVVKDANGTTISTASVTADGGDDADTYSTITFSGGYTVTGTQTFKIYGVVSALNGSTNGDSVAMGVNAAGFTWTDSTGNGTASAGAGSLVTNFPDTTVSTRTN
jgi:hypothetical protein